MLSSNDIFQFFQSADQPFRSVLAERARAGNIHPEVMRAGLSVQKAVTEIKPGFLSEKVRDFLTVSGICADVNPK